MFWKSSKKLQRIQKRLLRQQATIETYIRGMSDDVKRNRIEWCTIHQRECKSTGLLMWEKDLEFKYTFLNSRHCNDFFKSSLADVRDLIGKTDLEIISDFTERTGTTHTFGEMCVITDRYTLKENKTCRFWEIGYIGEHIFILDVTKAPLYKNLEVVGVQSWAMNQSAKECEIKALLEIFIKNNQAIRLNPEISTTASYLILKQNNPFNGVFPK